MYDVTLTAVQDALRVNSLDKDGGRHTTGQLYRQSDMLRLADVYADDPTTCAAIVRHGCSALRAMALELGELYEDHYAAFTAHYLHR